MLRSDPASMPTLSRPPRNLDARAQAGIAAWVHAVLCMLAVCVGLQAVTVSANRAAGRAHRHAAQVEVTVLVANNHAGKHEAEPDPFEAHRSFLFRHRSSGPKQDRHDQEVGPSQRLDHHHSGLAHHDHDEADASVVYVTQHDGFSSASASSALSPVVLDLDGLLPPAMLLPLQREPDRWPPLVTTASASHVTLPLERPPQA